MQNRHTPRYKSVKILLAMLLVGLVFFTPVVNKTDETPSKLQSVFPELKPFASSADACPWACIECTSWDDSAWPRGCATYECNAACEGEPGSGGGGPVYQPPTISHVLTCSNPGTTIGASAASHWTSAPQTHKDNPSSSAATSTARPSPVPMETPPAPFPSPKGQARSTTKWTPPPDSPPAAAPATKWTSPPRRSVEAWQAQPDRTAGTSPQPWSPPHQVTPSQASPALK
jgi:hypothetical protein